MKLVKAASGKETIKISKKDWKNIGIKAGWMKSAATEEIYFLDKGVLYDEDGEEVFDMKKLIKYFKPMKEIGITKIPRFKTPQEANGFLARIEEITGDNLGRLEDENLMKTLRYKDTRKELQDADLEMLDERNEKIQKNIEFQDPKEIAKKRKKLEELEQKERIEQLMIEESDEKLKQQKHPFDK